MYLLFYAKLYALHKTLKKNVFDIFAACNIGYFGVDCNEKCGRCLELYQCNHITGTCLTGCEAGYQGSMCKTRM